MDRWCANDRDAMLSPSTTATRSRTAMTGQGGFEIRTFIAVAATTPSGQGHVQLLRADPDLRGRLHGRPSMTIA